MILSRNEQLAVGTAVLALAAAGYVAFTEPPRESALSALEPDFRGRVEKMLRDSEVAGVPLIVLETRRSLLRQFWLWLGGRVDKTRPQVTKVITKGRHLTGEAIDVWPKGLGFKGVEEAKARELLVLKVRPIANRYGLDNPIEWDRPHFQRIG